MKALVTGGAGFIGSHLVDALIASGYEVAAIDNLATGDAGRLHPEALLYQVSVEDKEAGDIVRSFRPDVVFHLAAQVDVQRSLREPDADAEVNVTGTARLLKACVDAAVGKLVFSSTSAVYGDTIKPMIDESDVPAPISYYGLSKWSAERYIALFHYLYGIRYTILRYANVYGPRQTAKGEGGVVALFLSQLAKGQPLFIHGSGEQTRDFIYVGDVVSANLAAIDKGDGQTLQIGTAESTSINRLADAIGGIHRASRPNSSVEVKHTGARAGDILHSCLANARAKAELEWQPSVSLLAGLTETYRHTLGAMS